MDKIIETFEIYSEENNKKTTIIKCDILNFSILIMIILTLLYIIHFKIKL